jgi:hypothetical protein
VPYRYATDAGVQQELIDPEDGVTVVGTCDLAQLDNSLDILVNGAPTGGLLGPDADGTPDLPPNESTIRNDIGVSDDYSITKKDMASHCTVGATWSNVQQTCAFMPTWNCLLLGSREMFSM